MATGRHLFLSLAGSLVISLLASAAGAAVPIYDLGTLGGTTSFGYAVNSSGQVAGFSRNASNQHRPFLYTGTPGAGGTMYDLGTFGGTNHVANAINASGLIVGGSSNASGDLMAFRYSGIPGSGGTMTPLGMLSGATTSTAAAVNSSGVIVGSSGNLAFVYSGGSMNGLSTLGGTRSAAAGINDSGQIVGDSTLSGDAISHAFLYTGGTMTDLGTLYGGSSAARAINAGGVIVGSMSGPVSSFPGRAFRYSAGTMQDLGTLGGDTYANGINDAGVIVGASVPSGEDFTRAFLYVGIPGSGGQMINVDAWLDATDPVQGAKWTLTEARGITNNGLIAGFGTYFGGPGPAANHAFLFDASALLPEPSGLAPLVLLTGPMLSRRRRSA